MAISEATAPRCGWQRNDRPGRRWCSMHRCRSANCWHGYASLWSIGCRRPVDGWRSLWRARWVVHVYSVGRRQVYGLAQIVRAVHAISAPPSPRYTCPPPPRLVRSLKECHLKPRCNPYWKRTKNSKNSVWWLKAQKTTAWLDSRTERSTNICGSEAIFATAWITSGDTLSNKGKSEDLTSSNKNRKNKTSKHAK